MLLVGGDSFGVFDEENLHWAKIISNGNAKSVALGGRDISTTTYATMQELYKNNYTHCIFFITNFARIGMQALTPKVDIVNKQLVKTPNEEYNKPTIDMNSPYWTTHLVDGTSFWNESIIKEELDTNSNVNFLFQSIPDFAFTHDRLGNLALIKNYCQIHNIKLVFASNFITNEWRQEVKEFLDIDLFDLGQIEFNNLPSHYNKLQHKEFAELFNNDFDSWWVD